jgi:DNA replication protein DnaC
MKYIINKNSDIRFMCKFINENELINEIVGFNQKEIYQKYINYDLLVIDELGLKGGNEKIFSVIDGRYNKLKSTIITTNIDLTKTQDKILFRISERCFQSPNIVLYFNGESLRKNNNNNSSSNSNNNDQDKYIN